MNVKINKENMIGEKNKIDIEKRKINIKKKYPQEIKEQNRQNIKIRQHKKTIKKENNTVEALNKKTVHEENSIDNKINKNISSEKNMDRLSVNKRIVLHGLKTEKYNGEHGIIKYYNESSGRYGVEVINFRKICTFLPKNIKILDKLNISSDKNMERVSVNQKIVLHGLKTEKYNGEHGIIKYYNESSGRYGVEVIKFGKIYMFLPKNIKILDKKNSNLTNLHLANDDDDVTLHPPGSLSNSELKALDKIMEDISPNEFTDMASTLRQMVAGTWEPNDNKTAFDKMEREIKYEVFNQNFRHAAELQSKLNIKKKKLQTSLQNDESIKKSDADLVCGTKQLQLLLDKALYVPLWITSTERDWLQTIVTNIIPSLLIDMVYILIGYCKSIIPFLSKYQLNDHKKQWDLEGKSITVEDCRILSTYLMENCCLTSINLNGAFDVVRVEYTGLINNIGATVISEALNRNSTIKKLELAMNQIEDSGATAFGEALKENSSLKWLNLSDNKFGDSGAGAIAKTLTSNSIITFLDFSANKLGDATATLLSEALKINCSIQSLSLIRNKISDVGANLIALALMGNTNIKYLYLKYNKLSKRMKHRLETIMLNHVSLYFDVTLSI